MSDIHAFFFELMIYKLNIAYEEAHRGASNYKL